MVILFAIYDGRVQAVAQMGLSAGMPLQYDYKHDVIPTPPTKLGGYCVIVITEAYIGQPLEDYYRGYNNE